jgi:hypothetical protein
MGYMILTLPSALARRMARNWARKYPSPPGKTESPASPKRVHLHRDLQMGQKFVAAQIQACE